MARPISGIVYEVKLSGLKPVLKLLNNLPEDMKKRGLKTACAQGAGIIRRRASENFKAFDDKDTREKIYRNLAVQFAPYGSKRVDGIMMRVGVRGGAKQYVKNKYNSRKGRVGKKYATGGSDKNPGGDTWYWRFIEFGVPALGISEKRPMLKALNQSAQAATDKVVTVLRSEVDRYVSKNRARA